jgi:hypothetical protein
MSSSSSRRHSSLYFSKVKSLYASSYTLKGTKYLDETISIGEEDKMSSSLFLDIHDEFSSESSSDSWHSKVVEEWKGVENLDLFLREVYLYHCNGGFSVIMLSRIANLL